MAMRIIGTALFGTYHVSFIRILSFLCVILSCSNVKWLEYSMVEGLPLLHHIPLKWLYILWNG